MHIENGRIYDTSLRKSVPLGSTRLPTQAARAEIDADVKRFLANGGQITRLDGYHPQPKQPHRPPTRAEKQEQDQLVRQRGRRAIGWPESVHIKDQLFAAGLTYKLLAEMAGVPHGTLSLWFQKIMIPSNAWKSRIDEAFQTLLAKHGKPPTNRTR
jgi:hypothetical protein